MKLGPKHLPTSWMADYCQDMKGNFVFRWRYNMEKFLQESAPLRLPIWDNALMEKFLPRKCSLRGTG